VAVPEADRDVPTAGLWLTSRTPIRATDNSRRRRDIGKRAIHQMWPNPRRKCGPRALHSSLSDRLWLAGGNFGRLDQQSGVLRAEDLGAESHRRVHLRLLKRPVRRLAATQTLDQ
jgi:hypothetical protein